MSSSPDHVYLDLSTVNNDTTGSLRRPLNFTETRTMDIIDNPSNYYMSVIRFEVDTPASSLPIFMPKLLLDGNNVDINKTAYSITIGKPNLTTGLLEDVKERYVEWSPQEKAVNLPNNLYTNTGVPNTSLDAVVFEPVSTINNDLPLTNPGIIKVQTDDPLISPSYQYAGSPLLNLTSQLTFTTANSHAVVVGNVANGGPSPFQMTIGTFRQPVPALTLPSTASQLQMAITYGLSATTATAQSITEVLVPSGGDYLYTYLVNGNCDAMDFVVGVSIIEIDLNNSSMTQFLGKVPRILSSTYLSSQTIDMTNFDNVLTTLDDNYFNIQAVQSTNATNLAPIGATMTFSRVYYANLPADTYNYATTNWTDLPAAPIPLTELATYNYSQPAGTKVSYTMVLGGGETSPCILAYLGGFSCELLILVSNPTPQTETLQFLDGSTFNFATSADPGTVISRTILNISLPEIVQVGASVAYKISLVLNSSIPLPALSQRLLTTCSFTNVDLNVINDSRTFLAVPPPTQPVSIVNSGSVCYINDTIATDLTLLGRMKSQYQVGGRNFQVFSLSYPAIFTPPATFPTTVQYNTINFAVYPITPTLSTQDYTTGYYNCYNVKWWLNCVNATLALLWDDLGNPAIYAPQIVVDSNTNLMTLMTPYNTTAGEPTYNFAVSDNVASTASYLGTGSSPAVEYSMFFNEPLYNLFSAFTSIHYGSTTIGNAQLDAPSQAVVAGNFSVFAYYIQAINYNFKNFLTTNNSQTTKTQTWFITESEYSPVPMWNPVSSLIFSTSFLPVQMSLTTNPNVYGSNNYDETYANGANGNNSQITTMISDIQVPLTTGSEYKPTVLYAPSNEYRLIDLNGNVALKQAAFSISWKTKFGEVIPFYLGSLCGANLKIMFRRKRFNLGNVAPYDTN